MPNQENALQQHREDRGGSAGALGKVQSEAEDGRRTEDSAAFCRAAE